MKPIVGLVGSQMSKNDNNFIDSKFEYVQNVNSDAIRNAGGWPMILPTPNPKDVKEAATAYLEIVDALFLLGGEDSDPNLYGQEPSQLLDTIDQKRDYFEIELYKQARAKKMPIFGICRGLQVINVAAGGTLFQDLSLAKNDKMIKHSQLPTTVDTATHSIKVLPETWLANILGETHMVNTVHHQIIDRLGTDLVSVATASDGVIEAINSTDNLVWAVQFHPEWLAGVDPSMQEIFNQFVAKIK